MTRAELEAKGFRFAIYPDGYKVTQYIVTASGQIGPPGKVILAVGPRRGKARRREFKRQQPNKWQENHNAAVAATAAYLVAERVA